MAFSSDNSRSSFEAKLLRCWVGVCVLVGAALCLSQLAEIPTRSALRGYDNTFNYLWLRSAMVDGDWDFRNDLQECNTLIPDYRASALALPPTATGRIPNKYGIGWSVLTLPFYIIADLLVRVGRGLNLWSYTNDGFNPIYQGCIQLGHAALGVLALVLATRTIAAWLGEGRASPPDEPSALVGRGSSGGLALPSGDVTSAAIAGVVTVWAASSLIYYQSVNVSMSHGAAFFAVAVLAYALTRVRINRNKSTWWLIAGLGWGLAVTVRYQLAVFVLPVLWSFLQPRSEPRQLCRAVFYFAAGAAPFIALQIFAWRVVYGEWFVFSYGVEGESFHWGNPAVWNSLFSSWHGLFYWHAFTMVGLAGMLAWAWASKAFSGEATAWTVAFFLTLYANAAWWCWWFASSFGNRGYDAALLPLMAGVAWFFYRLRGWSRALIWTAAITLGTWNFYVVLLYRTGTISRQEPVTWTQMIEAAARLGEALKF